MFVARRIVRAKTLDEAWQLYQKRNNQVIGGMHWLKMGSNTYDTIIDLSMLGLDKIVETDKEIKIGAMCTLRDLEKSECLNSYSNNAVYEAVHHIVGVQFRNTATVGASIYRRAGFSDIITVFMAMDSYVELYKGGVIPLSEYVYKKWDRDIVVNLIVKKSDLKICFKSMRNTKTDFSVVNIAVSKNADNGYKIVVGARPMRAVIVEENVALSSFDDKAIKELSQSVAIKVSVADNVRASGEYRKHLVSVLCQRAIKEIGG